MEKTSREMSYSCLLREVERRHCLEDGPAVLPVDVDEVADEGGVDAAVDRARAEVVPAQVREA